MTGFPGSPKLIKGSIVLLDAKEGTSKGVIVFQYNPDTLTRSLQVQGVGDGTDRSEALRLRGPPVETIKIEAEMDIADQLDLPVLDALDKAVGLHPQLAALETLVYPTISQLNEDKMLASQGKFTIFPLETPLTLFVWSVYRVLPVRVTELSITEEAFDPLLNPIRAKISLGLRVLNVTDLGFDHHGGGVYMEHLRKKEFFATLNNINLLKSVAGVFSG
jgi:hypothetical protein